MHWNHQCQDETGGSAVFSDFAAPLQDIFCGPGTDPKFLVSDTG